MHCYKVITTDMNLINSLVKEFFASLFSAVENEYLLTCDIMIDDSILQAHTESITPLTTEAYGAYMESYRKEQEALPAPEPKPPAVTLEDIKQLQITNLDMTMTVFEEMMGGDI